MNRCSGRGSAVLLFLATASVLLPLTGADFSMTLLHTQDENGNVLPMDLRENYPCTPVNASYYEPVKGGPCVGGIARRVTYISEVRANVSNVMLVDAGNSLVGSLYYLVFGSQMMADYLGAMRYDAVKVDVHDFTANVSQIGLLASDMANTTATVCNNIVNANNDSRIEAYSATILPYKIVTYSDGQSVAFTGTMAADVNSLIAYPGQINSTDELTGMRNTVAQLQDMGIDKIIVATSGPANVDAIREQVPGIDVIIVPTILLDGNGTNGTTSQYIGSQVPQGPYPTVDRMPWGAPVLTVAAGINGVFIGRLDLVFDDYGVIRSWSGAPVALDDGIANDPATQASILTRQAEMANASGSVVGHTQVDLGFENSCYFGECGLGDLLADMQRQATGADFAIINGGNFYAPISAGAITIGDVSTAMPFIYTSGLITYGLQGRYVLQALEQSVSLGTNHSLNINEGIGRFLQVSGIRYVWNPTQPVGWRISEAVVLNRTTGEWDQLDMGTNYTVASFKWFWIGGDGYTMIEDYMTDFDDRATSALALMLSYFKQFDPSSTSPRAASAPPPNTRGSTV